MSKYKAQITQTFYRNMSRQQYEALAWLRRPWRGYTPSVYGQLAARGLVAFAGDEIKLTEMGQAMIDEMIKLEILDDFIIGSIK